MRMRVTNSRVVGGVNVAVGDGDWWSFHETHPPAHAGMQRTVPAVFSGAGKGALNGGGLVHPLDEVFAKLVNRVLGHLEVMVSKIDCPTLKPGDPVLERVAIPVADQPVAAGLSAGSDIVS
jgi:hypothetical protein